MRRVLFQVTDANSNHQLSVLTSVGDPDKTKLGRTNDAVLQATTRLAGVVVNMCRDQTTQSEQYMEFVKVGSCFSFYSKHFTDTWFK